jgi:hypothetical protein
VPTRSVSTPCSMPNRVRASRRAGISPRSSRTGGRRPDIRARSASASSASSFRTFESTSTPRSTSPAPIIRSAASSESDAAETPCTGPSWRSRAIRLRSDSIAEFVRRSRLVRSSSFSCRNFSSERMVWSAALPGVTSRISTSLRGGSVGISDTRDSRYKGVPSERSSSACPAPDGSSLNLASAPSSEAASACHRCPSTVERSRCTI